MNVFGTSRRLRDRICAELSTSRWSAAASSTGWTALRNALAKAPDTACSRRLSNRCSMPMVPPLNRTDADELRLTLSGAEHSLLRPLGRSFPSTRGGNDAAPCASGHSESYRQGSLGGLPPVG